MSDFEMPYFVDGGGGNKGYFKDSTAREQVSDTNDQIYDIIAKNNLNSHLMKNRGDVGGDLNNIKANGFYTYRTTDTNTPSSWGTLMVINVTPESPSIAWIFQVAFATDGHIYHRQSINGAAFAAWSMIV